MIELTKADDGSKFKITKGTFIFGQNPDGDGSVVQFSRFTIIVTETVEQINTLLNP